MRIGTIAYYLNVVRAFVLPGHFRIGSKSQILSGAYINAYRGTVRIGKRAKINRGAIIDAQKGSIVLGDNVSINPYSILYGLGGITIGDHVRIAAQVVIVSFDHNYQDRKKPITMQGVTLKPIVIEDDVWIGAGAKILGGSYVARGCIIGANAVVKGRTEPYGIYVGSPAVRLKDRGTDDGTLLLET
ncbi:acyltransferase [Pararhizobium antarcticum]|uniref:Acetyltransferase n=1 Tax=Pararhizobium antarcticum TaxID=1798805 RepID=A0A657LTL0_9HYPH|nr:acyltransferase [Pararhizobium antarcticum]OJF96786.1 acetyltransferase [Pararhizobium antarcticum]OJF98960.1 acetyltransferase [Rhizobium sp. 58]